MITNFKPIRIIIADNHPLCLSGFKRMLDIPEIELVGEAANGKELVDVARKLKPDIIITDIKMPIMDGLQATKQIIKELPGTKIIVLSMIDEYNVIMDMMDAGAKGYLLKSVGANEIIEAVLTVYKGQTFYCKETTSHMIKMLAKSDHESIQKNARAQFSQREIDVIRSICKGHSNKEIAKQLNIKKRTAEWHREQILQKLDAKNTASIVAFAIRNNIC